MMPSPGGRCKSVHLHQRSSLHGADRICKRSYLQTAKTHGPLLQFADYRLHRQCSIDLQIADAGLLQFTVVTRPANCRCSCWLVGSATCKPVKVMKIPSIT